MTRLLRSIVAIGAGGVVAVITYWIGAVVALILLRGIPLGSSGGPPTTLELALHLVLAALACFLGAALSVRLSGTSPKLHAVIVALILGTAAFVGFGKPASSWPRWFGAGMAAACLVGGAAAAAWATRRA